MIIFVYHIIWRSSLYLTFTLSIKGLTLPARKNGVIRNFETIVPYKACKVISSFLMAKLTQVMCIFYIDIGFPWISMNSYDLNIEQMAKSDGLHTPPSSSLAGTRPQVHSATGEHWSRGLTVMGIQEPNHQCCQEIANLYSGSYIFP